MKKNRIPKNLESAMNKKSDKEFLQKIGIIDAVKIIHKQIEDHGYEKKLEKDIYREELVVLLERVIDQSLRQITDYHRDSVLNPDSESKTKECLRKCGVSDKEIERIVRDSDHESIKKIYSEHLNERWESVDLNDAYSFNHLYAFLYGHGKIPLNSRQKLMDELLYCKEFVDYAIKYSADSLE